MSRSSAKRSASASPVPPKRHAGASKVQNNRTMGDIRMAREKNIGMLGWLPKDVLNIVREFVSNEPVADLYFCSSMNLTVPQFAYTLRIPIMFAMLGDDFAQEFSTQRVQDLVWSFVAANPGLLCPRGWAYSLGLHAPASVTKALCEKIRKSISETVVWASYRAALTLLLRPGRMYADHKLVPDAIVSIVTKPLSEAARDHPKKVLELAIIWRMWDVAVKLMRPPFSLSAPVWTWDDLNTTPGWENVCDAWLENMKPAAATELCATLIKSTRDNAKVWLGKLLKMHAAHIDCSIAFDLPNNSGPYIDQRMIYVLHFVTPSESQCQKTIVICKSTEGHGSNTLSVVVDCLRTFPHDKAATAIAVAQAGVPLMRCIDFLDDLVDEKCMKMVMDMELSGSTPIDKVIDVLCQHPRFAALVHRSFLFRNILGAYYSDYCRLEPMLAVGDDEMVSFLANVVKFGRLAILLHILERPGVTRDLFTAAVAQCLEADNRYGFLETHTAAINSEKCDVAQLYVPLVRATIAGKVNFYIVKEIAKVLDK